MKRNSAIRSIRILQSAMKCGAIISGIGLFLLIIVISPLYAQQGTLRFRRISPEDGLAHSKIYSLVQDKKGFLWIGTESGLNKYDGYTFKVYKNDPAKPDTLSHNRIMTLCEDVQGTIWAGTLGGLNKFDPITETFTRYQTDPKNPKSLSQNRIWTLSEDRSGTLWIGTLGGGLNKFDRETEEFVHYKADPANPNSLSDNSVLAIYEDQAGILWLGTSKGLNKFDRDAGQWTQYKANPTDPNSLSHNHITSITEDQAGQLWIGTANGLNAFDRENGQFHRYLPDQKNLNSLSSNAISSVHEDQAGQIWVGTLGGGLNKFVPKQGKFTRYFSNPNDPNSLSHNEVWTIFEDQSGVLWLGTSGGGVSVANPKTEQFVQYASNRRNRNSLSHSDVRAIYEDQEGILWIGTLGGLNKFDRKEGRFTHYLANPKQPGTLSYNGVWSILEDRAGVLWAGTLKGLNKYDRTTDTFTHYMPDKANPKSLSFHKIGPMLEDQSGLLWIGTLGGGLNSFDRKTEQFTRYQSKPADPKSLTHNVVSAVYEDRAGTLWVGTNGGLNRFDRAAGNFTRYQSNPDDPQSLSSNAVLSIYEDHAGTLWVGTSSKLNARDPSNNSFIRYSEKDGLPSDVIYGILEDNQGNLWFSTSKGIARFDPASKLFKNFDTRDGLRSNEFNIGAYHTNKNGEMFFGSVKGLMIFHPEQIQVNTHVPPVVMTDFQLFNKSVIPAKDSLLQQPVTETKEINLAYKDDVFSFEFVALDYTIPEKNQYAFMLEGFNPDWIPTTANRRFATFTNLDEGLYRFRVKAANNDGVWNEEGVSINISVAPDPNTTSRVVQFTELGRKEIVLPYNDSSLSLEIAPLDYALLGQDRSYMLEGYDAGWNPVGNRRYVNYLQLAPGKYLFKAKGDQTLSIPIRVTPPPWKTWWAYTLYVLTIIGIFLGYIRYKQLQYARERAILDRFVPYEYLDFLDKKSILDVKLGDHVSSDSMAVMFSDIRSFTTISEGMTPKENFDFVNAYLKRVAPVIRGQAGFIVKFLGDGMMAVFPKGAESGVKGAIEKLRQVEEYNTHRKADGWNPIKVGIGVHTGHMMVGMVGEKARMQGDAFSDNVNLTARLEGLTKYYGVAFLISGDTYKAIDTSQYHIRFLDNVAVKGKELPIKIYEVFDADPEELFEKKQQILPDFKEAQRLYFGRQFEQALPLFQKVLEVIPGDLTTELYVERCETLVKEGIPENWDGVRKMDKK